MNQNGVVIYCVSCGAPVVGLVNIEPCPTCGTKLFSTTLKEPVLTYNDKRFLKAIGIAAE